MKGQSEVEAAHTSSAWVTIPGAGSTCSSAALGVNGVAGNTSRYKECICWGFCGSLSTLSDIPNLLKHWCWCLLMMLIICSQIITSKIACCDEMCECQHCHLQWSELGCKEVMIWTWKSLCLRGKYSSYATCALVSHQGWGALCWTKHGVSCLGAKHGGLYIFTSWHNDRNTKHFNVAFFLKLFYKC